MQLPSDPNQRKRLKGFLEEAVREKTSIETCNDQLKVIRQQAKDEMGIDSTDFNKLLKAAYDESFADKNLEEAEELQSNHNILYPKQ